jgi:hypothetical protein
MSKLEHTKEVDDGARLENVSSPTICQVAKAPAYEGPPPVAPPQGRTATAKTIFGPFYSHVLSLQSAINHAERAHALIGLLIEEQDAARREHGAHELSHAEQWLSGRDSELLVFVGLHVEDWQGGGITGNEAATAIESYLLERIHEGLRSEFGREPACCLDPATAPTVTYTVDAASTRQPPNVAVSPAAGSVTGDDAVPPSKSPSSTRVSPTL